MSDMSVVESAQQILQRVDWDRERLELRKQKVLAWVNSVRVDLGKAPPLAELPRGEPGIAHNCVIAKCFQDRWAYVRVGTPKTALSMDNISDIETRTTVLPHPDYVRAFIRDFDAGKYPELRTFWSIGASA